MRFPPPPAFFLMHLTTTTICCIYFLLSPPPLSPSSPCHSLHSVTQLVIWEKGVVYVIVCVCYINLNFGKLETKLPHLCFFFFLFLFHAGCFSTPEFRVELKTFCQCPSYWEISPLFFFKKKPKTKHKPLLYYPWYCHLLTSCCFLFHLLSHLPSLSLSIHPSPSFPLVLSPGAVSCRSGTSRLTCSGRWVLTGC